MTLNCLPEFQGVTVQTVCAAGIQFESAWAITNVVTPGNHLPCLLGPLTSSLAVADCYKRLLSIFIFKLKTLCCRAVFGAWGYHLNKLGRGPLCNTSYQISCI